MNLIDTIILSAVMMAGLFLMLLCHSNFFVHYYPEVKDIYGPEIFGYNKKSHLAQIVVMLLGSMLLAWICTLLR